MDKTAKNNSNRFNPQKSMTGLFVALCQLRDANSERVNNDTCYIKISESGDGYKASLHEYNEEIEKYMKINVSKPDMPIPVRATNSLKSFTGIRLA